jgi:hypothetical protein
MIKLLTTLKLFVVVCFTVAIAATAQAQATRTFVSGVGNDADPCSRTAPCKTFSGALIKTATGGEISVLDPGGYGSVTINKAITIDGGTGSGWGSILASGVSGITINITTGLASDKVILRNLSINGNNSAGGFHGIRFIDGAELAVENVEIFNFTGSGISIAQSQASKVSLDHVRIDNSTNGISISTTVGEAVVMGRNLHIQKFTGTGITATNNVRLGLADSVIAHGVTGVATTGTNSIINADDIFVSFCTTGISGGGGSSINVSDSIIAQNSTGLSGTVNSFQGNSLINNTVPGAFIGTTLKQ